MCVKVPSAVATPFKKAGTAIQFAHRVWQDAKTEQQAAIKKYGRIFSE